ncbi:hypothetical protein [Nitrospirillum sp. BR 11828]|uniref:hypothetical protein n=1 Tax=Nitrospirillum sp. BR 11828 TaxID=3104325 RepID=UPI002ACA8250|nr:hypothetical protein [Nitrospirillum sp. BR 11828]MDZ5647154.1 hypothetical protein [Nitrospirillum sp. BR 11828]
MKARNLNHGGPSERFKRVNAAALPILPLLLSRRWLPDGKRQGREWVALNPRRADRSPGSFRVNIINGRWADFATGDSGGDVVSLAAYLGGISQAEACAQLAAMLGIDAVNGGKAHG